MDFGSKRSRIGAAALATACSAVLFYFGTGLAPAGVLTWFAPLPVLLVAPRISARLAATMAFLAFLLGTANIWGFELHSHDLPMFPIGAMINVGTSLMFLLGVLLYRALLRRRRALLAALAVPAVWVGLLYLTRLANPTGVLGTFAADEGDLPVVLQTASVAGMWGVEFLVLFAPAALGALTAPGVTTAARARTGTVAVLVLVLALGGGAWRLATHHSGSRQQHMAAIAPNHFAWAPAVDSAAGGELVAGYAQAVAALPDSVTSVVLPEAAFGSSGARPAGLVTPMRRVARQHEITVVVGFQHRAGSAKHNLALVFPAGGSAPRTYLKHHDLVSPHGTRLLRFDSAGASVGVEICADVNFAQPSRSYGLPGTRYLVIPASDNDANGHRHARGALMRGVENGIPVVWSAQNGTLMISDGLGRILDEAHTGGAGQFTTVTATVPPGNAPTVYSRLGDWFAWLCLALVLAGVVAAFLPPRKRDTSTPERSDIEAIAASAP